MAACLVIKIIIAWSWLAVKLKLTSEAGNDQLFHHVTKPAMPWLCMDPI